MKKSKYNIGNKKNIAKNDSIIDKLKQNTDTKVIIFIFQTFATDSALNSALKISTIDSNFEKFYTTCIVSKST